MEKSDYEELRKENERLREQLLYYKEYDLLTGLYNKDTFYHKVKATLALNGQERFNIVCVDIERFKMINDLYGSDKGNELLQFLAAQMQSAFADAGAVLGRIAADIFALCLSASVDVETIDSRIEEVFNSYPLDVKIMPAIGVYEIWDTGVAVELMCDRAILALNTVKGDYTRHLAVYDKKLRNILVEEHEIMNCAESALLNHEFQIYMQPKCNINTGMIVGAEALIRWYHPQRGMILPGVFIPVFEKNGFIKNLDIYMWNEVARWLRGWIDSGHKPVPISVNVSRIDIVSMDVFQVFQSIAKKYQLDPDLLEVEVTESAYMNRPDRIISTIQQLMDAGYTILMDDFGSGYSSLNMLKDINVDVLKLDMHFLDSTNQKGKDILESVVHMAKWLNLRVIAEGVETQDQVEFLMNIGCCYAQGYYFYKPMEIGAFEKLLTDKKKTDYHALSKSAECGIPLINFKDMFHTDVMTDQLFNNILGAIALYQYDGERMTVVRCNEEYYQVLYHDEMPEGGTVEDTMLYIAEEDRSLLRDKLQEAKASGDRGVEADVRKQMPNGQIHWIHMRLFYLSTINGKALYYASISDVTESMEATEKLKLSEQRFRIAMEAASSTLFELDIKTHTAFYASHSRDAFGLSNCVTDAPEGFIKEGTVCEEYEDVFRGVYNAIYQGAEKASCVIKARMGDGSTVWNRISLTAIKDSSGQSVKAVGVVEKVATEKELEEKIKEQKKDLTNNGDMI